MVLDHGGVAGADRAGSDERCRTHGEQGLGRYRNEPAGNVGILHHQLRVLDRHQPCRGDALGDSAALQSGMAQAGDASGGDFDGLLAYDGDADASDSHGAAVAAGVLDLHGAFHALRLRARDLAEREVAAGVGPERGLHVPDVEHPVRAGCVGTRLCRAAGQDHGDDPPHLRDPGDGMAREPAAVEAADHCGGSAFGVDPAGLRFSSQHSVLGLRYGGGGEVLALHDLRAVLRCRRGGTLVCRPSPS